MNILYKPNDPEVEGRASDVYTDVDGLRRIRNAWDTILPKVCLAVKSSLYID
jgi:hypothetical protein